MHNNVVFEYYDIAEDENALDEFNKLKNKHSIYDSIKAAGKVGIPTIVVDGKPYINVLNNKEDILKAISE